MEKFILANADFGYMDIQKIGKIQITIGIILLLVAVIGSVFIVKETYLQTLVDGTVGMVNTWGDVSEGLRELNETSMITVGHVTSDLIIEESVVKTTGAVFIACTLILIALSAILILQGLANLNRR